jgi:dihydropteroate synthase
MIFCAGKYQYEFPRAALVWGVVNVTPDSFSDGGKYFDRKAAVARAEELMKQGADVIDVGGESTRPNAEPVEEAEELRRVIPVIEELAGRLRIPISVDTMKPAVALAAVAAGASIINDVGANREDPVMGRIVAETGAGYVAMHMQGTPRTMQKNPVYRDVVAEVKEFFGERLKRLRETGVAEEQVVFDVGIGFGKTLEQNLQLLARMESFTNAGRPMLLGISRKSFLGKLSGHAGAERLSAALAGTALARAMGVQMFRTHDVAETVQALRATDAVMAHKK